MDAHADQYFGNITYSQHGEDLMLLNIFRHLGLQKPSYLDLGAHHPSIISNTKLLYERGSRGVNVEANPNLIAAFGKARPDDVNVHVGVGLARGSHPFYMYSDTSGRNTFSTTEVANTAHEMAVQTEIKVPVITIDEIVERFCNGRYPLFLSCDIEGLDFEVLKSAKFGMTPIVICVEVRLNETKKMTDMMTEKGYSPYVRMGENIIYIRDEWLVSLDLLVGIQ